MKKLMYLTLKQVLATLLCVAMLAGNAFALDSEALREKHGDSLEAKGIFLYGMHEFQEGLMPVLVNNSWNYQLDVDWVPKTIWNYIDEDLKIVDLNKGRFTYVYPFFEGLAAVIGDGGVGYIDKTGKIVIPCGFSTYDIMGTVYTGYFKNGTAPVLKEYVTAGPSSGMTPTYQVGRIDRTGKLVQPYKEMSTLNGQSFVSDGGDMLDAVPLPEEPSFSDKLDLWIEPPLVDSYADGKVYTITNNTGKAVKGYYALLSYWPETIYYPAVTEEKEGWYGTSPEHEYFRGFAYPFDVNLEQGEQMTGAIKNTVVGWSTMTHIWITFDDVAERDAFIKNDALKYKYDGYEIDMFEKGIQWMKDTFGITIKSGKPN